MSPRLRRSRKSLLFALLGYLALQIPLAVAIERYVALRDPMFGDKSLRLRERLAEKSLPDQPPLTVVMLGSSRTAYAFEGKRVEAILEEHLDRQVVAFNFGIPAAGPVTQSIYLNRILDEGVKPDLLLVEVLPSMLAAEYPVLDPKSNTAWMKPGPLEKNWFFPDRFDLHEIGLAVRYGYERQEVESAWWESVLSPWFALRFQLAGRVIPGWLLWSQRYDFSRGTDECGWGTPMQQVITPQAYRTGVKRARGEYEPVLATWEPGGPSEVAFHDLLRTCRDRRIPVVLVLMPEGTEFQSWYPPQVRQAIDRYIRGICEEYAIDLVDARSWLPDAAFSDSHHVLRAGAKAFSRRLAESEIVPRLQPLLEIEEPCTDAGTNP